MNGKRPGRKPAPDRIEADTTTPAVVLKLDRNAFHHGGLGVIRSLGRLGIPVYAAREDRWAPASASRYARGRAVAMPRSAEPEDVLTWLTDLSEKIGTRAVVVPTDDAGAILLAEHRDELASRFLLPAPPPGLPRRVADKAALGEICRSLGVPAPRSALIGSLDAGLEFAREAGWPFVAKIARPWALHRSSPLRSTVVVRDHHELRELMTRVLSHPGTAPDVLAQEYIPPAAQGPTDWFFHGYCDSRSRTVVGFTGVKSRCYPTSAGLTCAGQWTVHEELHEQAVGLLSGLSYQGIVDLDFRWDERRGAHTLLDFNPRIGAQFRLFVDGNGVDVARALHLDLTGRPVPAGRPVPGRRFVAENYDLIAARAAWPRRLGSVATADERAWLAADDLLPFGLMGVRTLWRGLEKTLR